MSLLFFLCNCMITKELAPRKLSYVYFSGAMLFPQLGGEIVIHLKRRRLESVAKRTTSDKTCARPDFIGPESHCFKIL